MESNSSFITFLVYDEVACVSSQISPMGNLRLSPQMNHIWVEINSEVAFVNFFHETFFSIIHCNAKQGRTGNKQGNTVTLFPCNRDNPVSLAGYLCFHHSISLLVPCSIALFDCEV